MKNQMNLLNQASHIIDCYNNVVKNTTTPIVFDFSEDVLSLANKYNIDTKGQEELTKVLNRITKVKSEKKNTFISIEDKSDMLMLQSVLMKLNVNISPEIADFNNNKFNMTELKSLVRKMKQAIPKNVNPFKIAKEKLESEGKTVDTKSLVQETGLPIKEAEKYLKRLEVIKLAQAGRTKK